jgi:hypothetical protein
MGNTAKGEVGRHSLAVTLCSSAESFCSSFAILSWDCDMISFTQSTINPSLASTHRVRMVLCLSSVGLLLLRIREVLDRLFQLLLLGLGLYMIETSA